MEAPAVRTALGTAASGKRALVAGLWWAMAMLSACATTRPPPVSEPIPDVLMVDAATLEVVASRQPWSQEQFRLERFRDGHWVAQATVLPRHEGQSVREVRLELDRSFRPLTYREEARGGGTPLSLHIRFEGNDALVTASQGEGEAQSRVLSGDVDLFMGDQLWHHGALIARAYVENAAPGKQSFKLFGGIRVVVEELPEERLELHGILQPLRHFVLDVAEGRMIEHVWLAASDLRLIKVEVPRALTATRFDTPEAQALSARPTGPIGPSSEVPLRSPALGVESGSP